MDPHDYSRHKAAAPGSAFYYSIRSIAPERQRAVTALHAFALEVRAIPNDVRDPGVARKKLGWWFEEIARVFESEARHPVGRALAEAVEAHGLDRDDVTHVLEGVGMNLEYNAYPDFEALEVYCRRVGGSVARLAATIYGFEDARTLEHAVTLGIASEITRIVRDVGDDARHGRVYLPLHDMAEHGVTTDELTHSRETDGFRRLVAAQIARAKQYYDRAGELLPPVDRKRQRPALAAAAIERALLREIEADGCRVLTRRISLTPIRMLWLAWRAR